MKTDAELLCCFVDDRSDAAFTELVQRHLGLVHSVALRRVGGDRHLAEDAAQKVFVDLARKAPSLLGRVTLSSWLYVSAHLTSAAIVRGERRRKVREEAHAQTMQPSFATSETASDEASHLRPLLDETIVALKEEDRTALMLRFFEQRTFAQIGSTLRVTEEAARKRVDRALEKLRALLARRGITSTVAALGVTLDSWASMEATLPATLGQQIARQALAHSAGSTVGASLLGLLQSIVPISGIVLVGAYLTWTQRSENEALTSELERLRGATKNLVALREENAALTRDIAAFTFAGRTTSTTFRPETHDAPAMPAEPEPMRSAAIFLSKEGSLRWDDRPVSLREFIDNLKGIEAQQPEGSRLIIRADPGAPASAMRYVIDEIRKAKIPKLKLNLATFLPSVDDWF